MSHNKCVFPYSLPAFYWGGSSLEWLYQNLLFRRTGPAPSSPALSKVCVIPSDFEGRNIWKEGENEIFWTITSAVFLVRISESDAQTTETEEAVESLG